MKGRLLKWLICPTCKSETLFLETPDTGEDVETGRLTCTPCGNSYLIQEGIPRLAFPTSSWPQPRFPTKTKQTFDLEWKLFAEETYADMAHIRHFVETAWGNPYSFRDKVVIDAGCGPGYFSAVFAEEAKEVIALDLTDQGVTHTQRRIGHLANVHVIQADLMRLPLRKEIADRVSSTGVLHHTPDPFGCFSSLVDRLKPGGEIAISVYSKYPWPARFFYQSLRKLTTAMTTQGIVRTARILVLFSYIPWRWINWIAYPWAHRWPQASYKRRLWWTYDWYSPEHVHFYSEKEIRQWYRRAGLRHFRFFPEIGGYYKGTNPLGREGQSQAS